VCKSNQFFNDHGDTAVANTCDVGPIECKTTASTTTCASCFPGWYLDANDMCVECPEANAYKGCMWDANAGAVADLDVGNALDICPPGFTLDE
jgi:hypothetical protein